MKLQVIAILIAAGFCSSCTVGPNYRRPAVQVPQEFHAPEPLPDSQAASFADLKWWGVFRDQELQSLIKTALQQNYDLRDAVTRVEMAQANLGPPRLLYGRGSVFYLTRRPLSNRFDPATIDQFFRDRKIHVVPCARPFQAKRSAVVTNRADKDTSRPHFVQNGLCFFGHAARRPRYHASMFFPCAIIGSSIQRLLISARKSMVAMRNGRAMILACHVVGARPNAVLLSLKGEVVGRLPNGTAAGGHGVAASYSGDVYLAQLSGKVQKFVKQ
jgi:hypothetical protein